MHPRAIVGPPGTMPHLNPMTGLPQLRRTLHHGGNTPPIEANPACHKGGVVQPNPVRTFGRGRTKITVFPSLRGGHACPPHMHWDSRTKQCVPDSARNPACHEDGVVQPNPGAVTVGACFPKFDPLEMYGVGRPPAPVPNPILQAAYQLPVIDPSTGLPRPRGSRWLRR